MRSGEISGEEGVSSERQMSVNNGGSAALINNFKLQFRLTVRVDN